MTHINLANDFPRFKFQPRIKTSCPFSRTTAQSTLDSTIRTSQFMNEDPALDAEFTAAPTPSIPALNDPWEPDGQIPLDGGLERQRFAPLLMAFLVLVFGFILFQLVFGPIAMFVLLWQEGVTLSEFLSDPEGIIVEHSRAMLVANTIGQILGLALPILALLGMHSSRRWAFIRLRSPDWGMMGLSIVGLAGLTPVAWWLGSLNAKIPLPEVLRQLEQSQIELIEQVFAQDLGVVFSLAVIAVTPAFCEEFLFRGYLQRQLERSTGVFWAIAITGVIFGMYHLRFSQVIPLSIIGIYMAYITWQSGSLWLAIVVHFLNNAFAVLLGLYLNTRTDIDLDTLERTVVPTPILLASFAVLGGSLYLMKLRAERRINALFD